MQQPTAMTMGGITSVLKRKAVKTSYNEEYTTEEKFLKRSGNISIKYQEHALSITIGLT